MPTVTALAGIHTSASGPEEAPTYVIKTVGMTGGSPVTLTHAEPDTVTWTLNQPDQFTFHFPKNAYTLSDVPVLGTQSAVKEVQLYRNGDLLTWGPVIGMTGKGADGALQATGAGVDWYLNRTFVDGPIPNMLTNGDFESGTSGWTAHGGVTFTTDGNNFETGANSAKLDSLTAGGDTQISQTGTAGPNGVGVLVTLSAWFYINTFTNPAFSFLGLYIEGGPSGGPPVSNNWYPIDSATRRGVWTKASTTLQVPPNETWDLTVKLFCPQGTIRWDDVKLVAMDSVSTAGLTSSTTKVVDIAEIMQLIVGHVQDTSAGKSALHIGTNCETTGVKMTKTYQYVDHVQFDQALKEFLDRSDGADYSIDLTPTTRTFHSYANQRGNDLTGSVTLTYDVTNPAGSNCTDYRFTEDGSTSITRQVVIGSDNGPDREQGESVDTSSIGGLVLEDVYQAPQNASVASLQKLAVDRLNRYSLVMFFVEMDLVGGSGFIPTIHCGDRINFVINDGYVTFSDNQRVLALNLDCVKNILTVTMQAIGP